MGSRGWQFTRPAPQLYRSILNRKSVHGALALTSSPLHRWNKLSRRLLTPESFKSTIWSFPSVSRSDCVAYLWGRSASMYCHFQVIVLVAGLCWAQILGEVCAISSAPWQNCLCFSLCQAEFLSQCGLQDLPTSWG